MRMYLPLLLLMALAANVQAANQGNGGKRLRSVSEWSEACARHSGRDRVPLCLARVHLAVAYGRSLGAFDLIIPTDGELLQSRSGVLLRSDLNHRVVRVKEDSGLKTIVELQDDVRCQTYAASPDLVGTPRRDRAYAPLIDSWLHAYSDTRGSVRAIDVEHRNGRPVLKFDVALNNSRALSGVYSLDESANAGIFSTCDYPAASVESAETARRFFDSIIGSARKYL